MYILFSGCWHPQRGEFAVCLSHVLLNPLISPLGSTNSLVVFSGLRKVCGPFVRSYKYFGNFLQKGSFLMFSGTHW